MKHIVRQLRLLIAEMFLEWALGAMPEGVEKQDLAALIHVYAGRRLSR
jgi:hypothetical protein